MKLLELLQEVKQAKSRKEIAELIQPLKTNELIELARLSYILNSFKGKNKDFIRNVIISRYGSKIDAEIILNTDLKET